MNLAGEEAVEIPAVKFLLNNALWATILKRISIIWRRFVNNC